MRILLPLLVLTLAFLGSVIAWGTEDHEIFDLVSDVEASEGRGTTFYSWLNVSPTATTAEIAKAYRRRSLELHPDKNPGVNGIHERFARLGVVATILRDESRRARYHHFYVNGVPKWRGTGYYYSRYRPGLGAVFILLAALSTLIHRLIQQITYSQEKARIRRFIHQARLTAWGPRLKQQETRKKVRVAFGGGGSMVDEDEDEVVLKGRSIDMVVQGENVYLLDEDGIEHPLSEETALRPSFARTWAFRLIAYLFTLPLRPFRRSSNPKSSSARSAESETEPESEEWDKDGETVEESDGQGSGKDAAGGVGGGRGVAGPAVKAGGRRRKVAGKRK